MASERPGLVAPQKPARAEATVVQLGASCVPHVQVPESGGDWRARSGRPSSAWLLALPGHRGTVGYVELIWSLAVARRQAPGPGAHLRTGTVPAEVVTSLCRQPGPHDRGDGARDGQVNVLDKDTTYRCPLPLPLTAAPYRCANRRMPQVAALLVASGTSSVQEPGPIPSRTAKKRAA